MRKTARLLPFRSVNRWARIGALGVCKDGWRDTLFRLVMVSYVVRDPKQISFPDNSRWIEDIMSSAIISYKVISKFIVMSHSGSFVITS